VSEFPWRGRYRGIPVLVVSQSAKRYRVQVLERSKVAGRWLAAGQQIAVAKDSVRREADAGFKAHFVPPA
jgi:hypothetical protein